MTAPQKVAIVDIGSNSVRLFLCDGHDDEGPTGERWATVTGLHRGAGPGGELAADALERLAECLAIYGQRARASGAARTVVAGTSAVRDAPNRNRVAEIVSDHLGAPLTVLSGEEEAACAYRGAALAGGPLPPRAVVDIGGASTEIIAGGRGGPAGLVSLDIGAVRCTEAAMPGDPPGPSAAIALGERVENSMRRHAPPLGVDEGSVLGVAGTFTTLAAMEIGYYSREAVDGFRLTAESLRQRAADLSTMTIAERSELPGLDSARAPTIGTGAVIASAALGALGVGEIIVSERDLLDGLALGFADLPQSSDFS